MDKGKIINMKNLNKILKKNILIIVMLILLCPVLTISYADFIIKTDNYRSNEMYMAELLYTMKINDNDTYILTVPVGESEHTIEITSLNVISSNYKLIYENNSNIKVEYASDYKDPAFGGILSTRTIAIRLTNNSATTQTMTLSVLGGYSFNEAKEINVPSGYTEITTEYWKYDYETTALYVNNKRVDKLDINKYYELSSYTCNEGATVEYDTINKKLIIDSQGQVKCSLYFNETIPKFATNFAYTGNYQKYTAVADGWYKIELWGAQGTDSKSLGGYSSGIIELNKGEELYVYVGQNAPVVQNSTSWNGGTATSSGYPGGGATDIRYFGDITLTEEDLKWDSDIGRNSRIMVAGGSGACSGNNTTTRGAGGGLIANISSKYGGFQIMCGNGCNNGKKFGVANLLCPGGNGYYPGDYGSTSEGGGGGSSFISGYAGVNAIVKDSLSDTRSHTNNTLHYSGKYFINGVMQRAVNSGHGKAVITYIIDKPKRNTKFDNVRYIRNCTSGSSDNPGNYWVEFQAIAGGTNVAKGKTPSGSTTGTVITDGLIATNMYAGGGDGNNKCVTIDFGKTYNLDEIAVWHYYEDGRTFYKNITSISEDNTTYTEVLNIEEPATSQGTRVNAYSS